MITTKSPLNVLWLSGVYRHVSIVTDYVHYAHIQSNRGVVYQLDDCWDVVVLFIYFLSEAFLSYVL